MLVRRGGSSGGGGALGTIAAILAFGLLGLALRVVPMAVTGDVLALAAAPLDGVPGPAATSAGPSSSPGARSPSPGPSTSSSPRPKAGPTTKPKPKPRPVPATGPGTYDGARTTIPAPSTGGRLIRYDVKVEKNLDLDPDQAARIIAGVLNDKRSWRGAGEGRFELVRAGSKRAELHAYIVTPGTTDELCAPLQTQGEVSCQNGDKVVLNAKRWVRGADAYGRDLVGYRRYLVNHEFGHYIGFGHVPCPGRGKPAPIMLQQTKGLDGCRKNPWVESD